MIVAHHHRQGDLLGDSRTAPVGITLLHFHDRTDEFCARSFRAELPMPIPENSMRYFRWLMAL
jgi:hypothetical protein